MPQEIVLAADVHRRMLESGWKEFSLAEFEVYFVSDDRQKLEKLGYLLQDVYKMKVAGTRRAGSGSHRAGVASPPRLPVERGKPPVFRDGHVHQGF